MCRSSASVMLLPDIKPKQTGEIEMTESAHWEEYRGSVVIPSQTEQRGLTVLLNIADNAVTVKFDEPVAGAAEWKGANVRIVERLKYHEIQFDDGPARGHGRACLEDERRQGRAFHCRSRRGPTQRNPHLRRKGLHPKPRRGLGPPIPTYSSDRGHRTTTLAAVTPATYCVITTR